MSKRIQRRKYWKEHYTAFIKTGLTQREYCRQHDLGYWTFNSWKRKLEKPEESTSLQEIPLKISENKPDQAQIKIFLSGNIQLSVPDNFSSETLKRVINTIGDLK